MTPAGAWSGFTNLAGTMGTGGLRAIIPQLDQVLRFNVAGISAGGFVKYGAVFAGHVVDGLAAAGSQETEEQ